MAEVVNMIALSPTMDEGTLAEWRKSEGDEIAEGEVLADVETDKATMEMESWYDGTLLKLLAEPNDAVAVGDPIAIIGQPDEDISDLLADLESGGGGAAQAEAPEPQESEPADEAEAEPADEAEAEPTGAPAADKSNGRLRASPLARRIAADKGVELGNIAGSGPSGRIIRQDVETYIEEGPSEPAAPAAEAPAAPKVEVPAEITEAPDLPGEEVPLSQMRKTIAKRLRASWQTTPHFALTVDIDMAETMARRSTINDELEAAGRETKLSVNDFIVKAAAEALVEYPKVNVSFQGDHLVQFDPVNVGVAVAVEDGLVTPTIRDADQKSLSRISSETRELARKARDKELMPEDYADGTFTVSNLGMFGIDHFMAVINPPQAAILACGAVEETPIVEDGELAVGTRMKVTLSCDHRAVDGAMGAEFLQHLKRLLENPVLLTV